MSEKESSVAASRKGEYSGSPAPFVFFLALFLIFLVLTVLAFPNFLSALFGIVIFVSWLGCVWCHYWVCNGAFDCLNHRAFFPCQVEG